jgi:hypothetical protein
MAETDTETRGDVAPDGADEPAKAPEDPGSATDEDGKALSGERASGTTSSAPPAPPPASERADTAPARSEGRLAAASAAPSGGAKAAAGSTATATGTGGPLGAYEALARSARLPDLVAITQRVVTDAAAARRAAWNALSSVAAAAGEAGLTRDAADTPYGNALKVLEAGPEGEPERALACALWAHAIAESKRGDDDRLAGDVLWLSAHTPFDATPLLDRALGDEAAVLWASIADRVRRVDGGKGAALGRGEALVGCAALCASGSRAAIKARGELARAVSDPMLGRLLASADGAGPAEVRLEGEAVAPPRGPVATALLGMTGLLFVAHLARLVARFALSYKRPTEVTLGEEGVRVKTRTEMLGKVLREREHVIVRSGLARVVREVRYPRAAFYAGLLALAVGSYVGVRALVDGVRSASPSLLLVGLLIVAAGIAADFVLGSLVPGARGRVRVSFVPRTGRALCVADVDQKRADEALTRALRLR